MEINAVSFDFTFVFVLLGIIIFTIILYSLIRISEKISTITAEKASKEFVDSQEKIIEEFNLILETKIEVIGKKIDKIEKFYSDESKVSKLKPDAITENKTNLTEIKNLFNNILDINEKMSATSTLYLDKLKSKTEIKKCIEEREGTYASLLVIIKELEVINSKLSTIEESFLGNKEGES